MRKASICTMTYFIKIWKLKVRIRKCQFNWTAQLKFSHETIAFYHDHYVVLITKWEGDQQKEGGNFQQKKRGNFMWEGIKINHFVLLECAYLRHSRFFISTKWLKFFEHFMWSLLLKVNIFWKVLLLIILLRY